MDYIEVIEKEQEETAGDGSELKEMDFNSFYADYDYDTSSEVGVEIECEEDNDYQTMNLKQLLRIRDYYDHMAKVDIPKSKKHTKKDDIIDYILEFESNISNIDIVIRRHQLWKYINELKSDKYMKQFIFWS
jgi:hypothetical protein